MALKKLNILQWNCRSVNSNKGSLRNLLSVENYDIVMLCETWLKPHQQFTLPGYNIVRKDRIDGKAGVAILVKKGIHYSEITIIGNNFSDDLMLCAIEIDFDSKLNVVAVYRPPHAIVSGDNWCDLFRQFTSGSCLFAGDFNAHNTSWGSSKNDSNGNAVLRAVDATGLAILNNGKPTRLVNSQSNLISAVDLTLASPNIAGDCVWDVLDDSLGSDHFPIVIEFDKKFQRKFNTIFPSSKWNVTNTDWDSFRSGLVPFFQNPPVVHSAQEGYNYFVNSVNRVAERNFKIKVPFCPKNKHPVWWDDECTQAVNNRKKALALYKESGSFENYLNCRKVMAQTKRLLKTKARSSWRAFCSELNYNNPSAEVWRQVKLMKNCVSQNCRKLPSDEKLAEFFHQLAPDSVICEPIKNNSKAPGSNNPFLKPLSFLELENILTRSRSTTAPGMDNILYPMIRNLPVSGKEFLLGIFNRIYLYGENVKEFRQVIIVPIPKKDDSLRPISLLSCLMKTLERIIQVRLDWWLNSESVLPSHQYGFRKKMGTQHALCQIVSDIQLNFSRNNYLGAIFLDIEGAYNSVDLNLLQNELVKLELPSCISANIVSMYRDRDLYLRSKNNVLSGPRRVSQGLAQGAILSPSFFNIYTRDVKHHINAKVVQYADDFVFYCEEKSLRACKDRLKSIMGEIIDWCDSKYFKISADKSFAVIFTRHNLPVLRPLKYHDRNLQIPFRDEVKYLGLFLDQKLTWKTQIQAVVGKCEKNINLLKVCCRVSWGADVNIALILLRSLVRSILDYGCVFYASGSNSLMKRLDIVFNKALRVCLGIMNSSPVECFYNEANEPPLNLRRELIGAKFMTRLCALFPELYSKICQLATQDLCNRYWAKRNSPPLAAAFTQVSQFDDIILKEDPSTPLAAFERDIYRPLIICPDFSSLPCLNQNIFESTVAQFQEHMCLYTDGSKSDSGTGCAIYSDDNEGVCKRFQLSTHASIYTAESIAIMEAVKFCRNSQHLKFLIISDSLSVLSAIKGHNHRASPIIHRIRSLLFLLRESRIEVVLVWVKAHCGILGNLVVDGLAKEAAQGKEAEIITEVPPGDLDRYFKKALKRKWQEAYSAKYDDKPTNYFVLHPNIGEKKWYQGSFIPRPLYTSITRMKLGHTRVPEHLYRLRLRQDDVCECGEVGDLNHVLLRCDLGRKGCSLYVSLAKMGLSLPFDINGALGTDDRDVFDKIYQYVKENDIQI